jgi:hypothetical protein
MTRKMRETIEYASCYIHETGKRAGLKMVCDRDGRYRWYTLDDVDTEDSGETPEEARSIACAAYGREAGVLFYDTREELDEALERNP